MISYYYDKVLNGAEDMKKFSKITPEGTRDLLFEECEARRKVETSLSALFKMRGYNKVVTPTIEFFDVFNRESAGRPAETLYKMTDRQGRILALRCDNTLPIARVVTTRLKDAKLPLRLYYSQNVFRQSPSMSGHSDEIAQSGIELIGASGVRADLEVITAAIDALKKCGAPDFRLEIGHADFFKALLEKLDADDETRDDITEYIESKNFTALNNLLDTIGNSPETKVIKSLPRLFGGEEVLDEAAAMCGSEKALRSIEYLRTLFGYLSALSLGGKINIDLGLVHRSNYYTGVVFRGYIEGSGAVVLSGGRYDNLIGEFGLSMPAIGFGVDADALAAAMFGRGEVPKKHETDILIFGEKGQEMEALIYADEMISKGYVCENCVCETVPEAKKYAEERGIKRIDIVGGDGVKIIDNEVNI